MSIKLTSSTLPIVAVLSSFLTGCSVVKGIFRIGVWTGVLGVVMLLLLIGAVFKFLRRDGSN